MNTPKFGLILGYKHFFTDQPPTNRVELVRNISKTDLLVEFVACNYRIKPPKKIFFEYDRETNIKELEYHLRLHPDAKDIIKKQFLYHLAWTSPDSLIFHRASMLFAFKEILSSGLLTDIPNYKFSGYDQVNIFKYILLVNDHITEYHSEIFAIDSYSAFEKINLATLSLNEYFIPIDPLLSFYRAGQLYKFLDNTIYSDSVNKFFKENTGLSPHQFIYEITSIMFTKHNPDDNMNWYYIVNKDQPVIQLFEYLSTRRNFKDHELEFLDIKKSPFYHADTSKFILVDNMFLLSISYDFFIWNFLFDQVLKNITGKKERQDKIKQFKGTVGLFYESHLTSILERSLDIKKYYIRTFKNLIRRINKKEIEIADIYIRKGNKIIIGEAKTTSIINSEKYASNVEEFYNSDAEEFFKKHGLIQLIEAINQIMQYGKLIDKGFPRKHIKIFPVIFYNDILLSNPFFPKIFNDYFKEKTKGVNIPCLKINPLVMMHISDVEMLEETFLNDNPDIFKLIEQHLEKYQDSYPFFYSSNKVGRKSYSEHVTKYYHSIIKEFNPENHQGQ